MLVVERRAARAVGRHRGDRGVGRRLPRKEGRRNDTGRHRGCRAGVTVADPTHDSGRWPVVPASAGCDRPQDFVARQERARAARRQGRTQYETARKRLEDLQGFARDQALRAARAQRDAAKAKSDAAQAQFGYTRITSPIEGVVTDLPFYPGETAPGGAPIVTVMDLSQVIARTHISQAEAAELTVGADANLVGPGGAPIPAKVTQISPALDATNTTVEVWVQADNREGKLRPGTNLRVEMIAKTVPNTLVIPRAAVLTSASGSTYAIVIDNENKPQLRKVMIGIRDSGKVQVTDGLASGQRVATSGAFELFKLEPDVLSKTKVQIAPAKEEEEPEES